MAPMEIGSSGSSIWRGTYGGRKVSTWSCSGMSTRSVEWVRMNPSMHTMTGTDSSSANR